MWIYVVEKGDSLYAISQRVGVNLALLAEWNGLSLPERLTPGQALLILEPLVVHTVKPGDTLWHLAQDYGVTVAELYRNNPSLGGYPELQPGLPLVIRFADQGRRAGYISGYAYPSVNTELLRTTLPYLTSLLIFTYGFNERGGLEAEVADEPLLELARRMGSQCLMVLAPLDENGAFNNELIRQVLPDEAKAQRLIGELVAQVEERGYAGVVLDLEYVPAELAQSYADFAWQLGESLRERGLELEVALAPKTSSQQRGLLYEGHDYAALGAAADRVMLMTYEWGYTYGPPMAVAPLPQVRQVVEYALTQLPPEKIVMGVPNYGYDWTLPYQQGRPALSIGNQQAVEMALRYGAEIYYDETVQAPYFYYYTEAGTEHVVWFEDPRSIEAKITLAQEMDLAGLSYWTLQRPFTANWLQVAAAYRILRP